MKKLLFFVAVISLIECQKSTAPTPQTISISAGSDTTIPKNAEIYLTGDVIRSDFPDSLLRAAWSQISGPGVSTIADSSSLISRVTFPLTGIFSFKLVVSSGAYTVSDTVSLIISDSIPFKVLAPAGGERITVGSGYLIRWRTVSPMKTIIFLTCDKGKTYTTLTPLALDLQDTSWLWNIDSSLMPSDSCKIRVADYFQRSIYTESEFFSLVR